MKVSAVVVSHGHAEELGRLLPALLPQVDELVVVANTPGSAAGVPEAVRVLENPRPLSARSEREPRDRGDGRRVGALREPGHAPGAGRGRRPALTPRRRGRAPASSARSCAGRTGRWQPSRRRFPTVGGTLVRRTPLRRLRGGAYAQRDHYLLDERPSEPVQADWLLGAFLLQRRELLDELGGWDAGFRHYCEDIDLCYRAARAGWERWYVPAAVATHDYAAVIDKRFLSRHTLWHARGMARFVRKHPERLLAR